ncbi:MAG TPA: exonuclease domain-containing protein [Flavobacteriaceae bacterium]|nr:GIY-YIG nuclease family protein [Flavobacteriaceae bacterium]MCB9213707.1 GIY-YIG nuclease family protein [Alteromonas sp.]HPF11921.1 exonuclease domain-containing protein [Flavobacteriaceae bacterium]HQU21915.1 exonuclease domain-containing protein [Flavobacteriaceae bacterium]HQU65447.1 exonuclease domain-containing protein [Flavobacteriaceae bacterium]
MNYAILDIETTGGKYNEEGITEIAIYRFDGHGIVDQFCSLINPERSIQPFVVNLTGINNEMLRNAPKFYEVAKRIIEITENAIVVAHNAQFDHRILATEFDRLGYEFEKDTLCTVELAKKLIPGKESYSLGKLCRSLGIPISDRHRAQGDAMATVTLFKMLLARDTTKEIVTQTVRKDPKRQLEPKLLELIDKAPTDTGVYYMHRADGSIIYIGKSKNIRKRLIQHFTSDNRKSKKMQLEVSEVTYEKTGSELIALLKESEEIKRNKPLFNRALRRSLFTYQLSSFTDDLGYLNLKIEKADSRKKAVTTFSNFQQAKSSLYRITEKYQLCQKLTGLYETKTSCFLHSIKECHGACIGKESPGSYNERATQFLDEHSYANKHMLIIDHGRDIDERSVVLIENGKYIGFGFFNLNYQINNPEVLKSIITPMQDNRDSQHIIQTYLRKNKVLKIINLATHKVD